jgi:endonuclease-8
MPEGPEIRRAADRLEKALVGQRLRRVYFAFDRLEPFARRLRGRTVRVVAPWGKAMLIRCGDDLTIYSHNQLYGKWFVCATDAAPRGAGNRQLRLGLHTAEKSALLYSASDIEVLDDEELARHPFLSRLGPDVLDPAVTPATVAQRLAERRFRGRNLAQLLLDQGFLCGLGNYLRSEILFVAGIDPARRARDLDTDARDRLADVIVRIARQAYRERGVTNDLDRVRLLKAEGIPRRAYRHHVFGRAGLRCYACGESVEKRSVGARRLYLCPVCQA